MYKFSNKLTAEMPSEEIFVFLSYAPANCHANQLYNAWVMLFRLRQSIEGTCTPTRLTSGPLLMARNFQQLRKVPNSCQPSGCLHTRRLLLLSEPGLPSFGVLPTSSLLSQANGVHWSLQGCSKARNTITNAIVWSPLSCVWLPVQNLMLKFWLLKFSVYIRILRLHTKYT